MVAPDTLRRAMSQFATGVAVISTTGADGAPHGMTANALTSVSLDPPLVLVCIAHQRNTYSYVQGQKRFGINFLAEGQADIARYFAREPKDRMGDVHVPWQVNAGASPKIAGALAFMDCAVVALYNHADHAIVVARVEGAQVELHGHPLVYYDRQFLAIGKAAAEAR